jgi:tetratricopeptide (TPR) repeat protein
MKSCLPCHSQRVRKISEHSRHLMKKGAPNCVSCHMPMTEFGRMMRSDHSFRPPSPAAGKKFKSPISCLICHKDKTPGWAEKNVKKWFPESTWQKKILHEGALIDAARKGQWKQLPEILAYLKDKDSEPVVVTSLIRLLVNCPDPEKWEPIRTCMSHASPLVRGAAAAALKDNIDFSVTAKLLLTALKDDYRLVRVQAVNALSRYTREQLTPDHLKNLLAAEKEYMLGFESQPDQWSSHYNLGLYQSERGNPKSALESYKKAIQLRDDVIQPLVNAALLISRQGRTNESIGYLEKAHNIDPENGGVNFNLGLVLAEIKDMEGAEKHLRLAMKDRRLKAQSAYNLAIIVAKRNTEEAIYLSSIAASEAPDNPRYAYTYAFYLDANKKTGEAIGVLKNVVKRFKGYGDAWILLGQCYLKEKRFKEARKHYLKMQNEISLPMKTRAHAAQRMNAIK